MSREPKPIPPELWGRDHASTLLYLETRVVDHGGKHEAPHMRRDGTKYPTRLRGGKTRKGHSDYDCVADMQAAGLLVFGTFTTLTDLGWAVAHALRRDRAVQGAAMAQGHATLLREIGDVMVAAIAKVPKVQLTAYEQARRDMERDS